MPRTKAKKQAPNQGPPVPLPESVPIANEPTPPPRRPQGRGPSPGGPPLPPHSGPNVSSNPTAGRATQLPPPAVESPGLQEEPEHEETLAPAQEPPDLLSAHITTEGPCPQDTSSPRLDLQATMTNAEQEEASLALLHSLKNETSRRVQPARYRPVGASDATTEGVDSSIIEAAEKARTVKPIIPPGTKFLLYNGPAKESEKVVKWELSAGQRAVYYGEKNGEGEEEYVPDTKCWEIEGWDALAEGEDDDELGHAPVVTNGATLDLSENALPNLNIIGGFDFSDATYINRHKKYTVVEKRHRLREQEMVQWELSKLPAKISQLRALDVNVFKGQTLEEKEQYRADMLDAAETLENRFTAIKNVATARKENRPIDPAGTMNYLTSWHQPSVPQAAVEEGDAEAGVGLLSTKKRKRYELEEDRDAGISALEWDEEEEFVIGIGRAPIDYAYAPGHHPSNRKKTRKEDRKKVAALNGGAPIPKKSKLKGKKKKPPPKLVIPPTPIYADGSSIAATDSASVHPRPPKPKSYTHALGKAKVSPSILKKSEMCILAMAAKRLAEGRREGREGGIPFGAPFPTGGFVLPYAGNHGEFQLPKHLAPQAAAAPESVRNVDVANTQTGAEETVPQETGPEPLVAENATSEEVGGATEAVQVQAPPRQYEAVFSAVPVNVLDDDDDDPLTELSSEDGDTESDEQDEQDEQHSTAADEDADGEGEDEDEEEDEEEEEEEDMSEEETGEGADKGEDTDSFRPEKSMRR